MTVKDEEIQETWIGNGVELKYLPKPWIRTASCRNLSANLNRQIAREELERRVAESESQEKTARAATVALGEAAIWYVNALDDGNDTQKASAFDKLQEAARQFVGHEL